MKTRTVSRREFIRVLGGLGLSVTAFETLRRIASEAPQASASGYSTSRYHWVMVIDLGKCTGCNFCTYACKATNDTAEGITWNTVFKDTETFANEVYIPRPCMHCENAPCVDVCPVGATYHRDDGLIVMDYDKCIGCRYCQVACPYGARYFNWDSNDQPNPMVPEWGESEVDRRKRGVVEKCTFCAHRLDAGLAEGLIPGVDREATPACVNVCPVGARTFGDLNDRESAVFQLLHSRESIILRDELGTNPRVYYLLPERSV